MRVTMAVAQVLAEFMRTPGDERYGYQLKEATGLDGGLLYPLLARMVNAGWLHARREDVNPKAGGRPPRVWYRLTADGTNHARMALANLRRLAMETDPDSTGPSKPARRRVSS